MQQAPSDEDQLMKAVSNQDVEGIKRFATKDNINKIYNNPATNIKGWTLLQYATHYNSVDSIKALLAKGANVNSPDGAGIAPLHLAVSSSSSFDNFASVEALLKGGADVNSPDEAGRAPLHLAISNYHNKSVKLLLEAKANIHLCDNAGDTPLHIAAERSNIDAAILLKNEGAIFDVTNNAGMKPLALAKNALKTMQARKKRPGDPSSLIKIVNFLEKDTWGNFIIPPADKEVVLSTAELIKIVTSNDDKYTKAEAIRNLLGSGTDPNINIETLQSKSPILQYFVCNRNLNLGAVGYLLEKGAKVNQGDQDGDTALHILAQDTSPDSETKITILELLLRNEGDLNIKNNAGKTPLEFAVENGQKEIADAMRESLRGQKEIADVMRETLPQINFFPWSEEINNTFAAKANADLIKVTLSDDAPDKKAEAIKNLLELGADPNLRLTKYLYETTILSCFVDDLNFEAVKNLLDKKANVNQGDEIGDTALHDLAKNSANDSKTKIDSLELLLKNGADPLLKNNMEKTALDCAVENGQEEIANAILDHLNKVNKKLIEVVSSKDAPDIKAEAIKNLLYSGADPDTISKEYNKNPILQCLVDEVNLEAVTLLLEKGAKVDKKDATGDTALHILIQARAPESETKIDILNLLLRNGGDPNIENNAGKTPIEYALEKKQKEIAYEIIKYAKEHNIKFPDKVNQAIAKEINDNLLKAVLSKDIPTIKNLLELGADPNIRLTSHNKNPILQYLVDDVNLEAVTLLLKKGVKVDNKDQDGDTALHVLSQARAPHSKAKIDILELLLKNGADLNKENNAGKTPLECAEENKQKEIADAIIKYANEHNIKFSDKVNRAIAKEANDNLLKVVSSKDAPDKKAEAIKNLLELGADPNIRLTSHNKNPILQYFVNEVNLEAVTLLLKKGAKVDNKDQDGDTALHVLSQALAPHSKAKIDILELLLKNGADLNIKNNAGKTPFDCALENGQGEIADVLMVKRVDKLMPNLAPSPSAPLTSAPDISFSNYSPPLPHQKSVLLSTIGVLCDAPPNKHIPNIYTKPLPKNPKIFIFPAKVPSPSPSSPSREGSSHGR